MSASLMTTRQVAERLGVAPATVLRRWRNGDLPGFRIDVNVLRFDAGEIDAWLATRRGAYAPPTRQLAAVETKEEHEDAC